MFTAIEFRFTRITVNGRAGAPVAHSSPNGLISTVRATANYDTSILDEFSHMETRENLSTVRKNSENRTRTAAETTARRRASAANGRK